MEIEVVRPQGLTVTAELRLVETDWEGQRARLISLRDVTDRKRAAERAAQLERERLARAEAEAASQAKSEFLATMSHELRTPLNAVIGYADLMDLGISGSLTAEQRKQVIRIRDSARHLLGLVNEVLDLSKVEAGRLAVHNRAARVADVVDAALSLVQPPAEARGIELLRNCDDADILYEGDEDRVRQILVNLLNNAVKFTPPGGRVTAGCEIVRRPESGARLVGSGPWICLHVTDTGIGIPPDRLTAIFDPFVQVSGGHTRQSDGSGLGLTISRRLARLMGGDLTVRSEQGKGSSFTLWLREASAAGREAALWRAQAPDAAARLQGLADVGSAMLRELPGMIDSFVDRLRAEPIVPGAESLRQTQLADHVAAYVADLAAMMSAIEEARGEPSRLLTDGAEIQTIVAERHGSQRARMGWTPTALAREWEILTEEMERIIRRGAKGIPESVMSEAMGILGRFLEGARESSARALLRTSDEFAPTLQPGERRLTVTPVQLPS
jgi:signal transduction histidine kinase